MRLADELAEGFAHSVRARLWLVLHTEEGFTDLVVTTLAVACCALFGLTLLGALLYG